MKLIDWVANENVLGFFLKKGDNWPIFLDGKDLRYGHGDQNILIQEVLDGKIHYYHKRSGGPLGFSSYNEEYEIHDING